MLAAGATVAGYRVDDVLGRGGMGVVYAAEQLSLARPVALKILSADVAGAAARERFRREAELQAGLDHAHVVTVYEAGEAPEGMFIAMQLIRGGTLRERIGDGLEPEAVLSLLAPIADALDVAHAAGLVHRDVKPRNILIDAQDRAFLADFGLVKALDGVTLTETGGFMGTPSYVSPEQVRGEPPTGASDVYALAAVLYECLTGSVVFPVDTVEAALYAHVHETPLPASARRPGLRAALDAALARGLAKDPAARPPGAGVLLSELRACLDPAAPQAPGTITTGAARRLVGVLCAQLAEGADPEARHAAAGAWAQHAAAVVERHGGTVAPAAGVDFLAVFGLAQLHDDDALRAVRAAEELAGGPAGIGVDFGLVFAEHTVTGAPVRSAVGLAQAAAAGEVRIGERTRVIVAAAAAPPRTPFVGRDVELAELRAALDAAREEPGCRFVTVLGPAGIGKSRLARELVEAVRGEWTVLLGRCPPYGAGLTYRPLAEMLAQIPPGFTASEASDELRILVAAGDAAGPAGPEETAWSARRLLERLAAERPVVAIVEDVHWAPPTLLDLLDHVAGFSSGAPLAIVCLARPELLEGRPGWAAPQPHRSLLVLEPLGEDAARRLATSAGAAEPGHLAAIVETAEGNPLFLEQLVTVQGGDLPPTVQAVLAARIDALAPAEREVLERASVLGRSFPVAALDDPPPVAELLALVRKQLLVPDRVRAPGEDGFRFAHALIRDAAYEGIARRRRAELHEQAAAWIEGSQDAPDRAALAGHHLEAAYRHRADLGDDDRGLAGRAAAHLQAAAESARRRGDVASAIGLLERALAMLGDQGAPLLSRLGAVLLDHGRFDDARTTLDEAVARGEADSDPALAARARVELAFLALHVDAGADVEAAVPVAEAALEVLEAHGDRAGQSRARQLIALARWTQSRHAAADEQLRLAADLAQAAGEERMRFEILAWSAGAAGFGAMPVPEAIERCHELRAQVRSSPFTVALVDGVLVLLHALAGDFARSRELSASVTATLADVASLFGSVSTQQALALEAAEDLVGAEQVLREDYAHLLAMGEQSLRSTTAAYLARVVLAQGREREADALAEEARRLSAPDDADTQPLWRLVRARLLAHRGRHDEAEALAREAITMLDRTDSLAEQAYAQEALAHIHDAAGRPTEAEKAQRLAVEVYDRKGATVLAERARRRLITAERRT